MTKEQYLVFKNDLKTSIEAIKAIPNRLYKTKHHGFATKEEFNNAWEEAFKRRDELLEQIKVKEVLYGGTVVPVISASSCCTHFAYYCTKHQLKNDEIEKYLRQEIDKMRESKYDYFWVDRCDEMYISGKVKAIWSGLHHSEESKNKTRQTMTPKNSTNPKIWVNKDGLVKYILKTKLNEYINDGWLLGRTGYKPRKGGNGISVETSSDDFDLIKKKKQNKKPIKNIKHIIVLCVEKKFHVKIKLVCVLIVLIKQKEK